MQLKQQIQIKILFRNRKGGKIPIKPLKNKADRKVSYFIRGTVLSFLKNLWSY